MLEVDLTCHLTLLVGDLGLLFKPVLRIKLVIKRQEITIFFGDQY